MGSTNYIANLCDMGSRCVAVACMPRSGSLLAFCVLAPEEVDGMDVAVLFCQVHEVPFERRLRRLGACNLDLLAEHLQPLLFPKH
jgi:hypothetical protein